MLTRFFFSLRDAGLKVSVREYLDLLSALHEHVVFADIEQFYALCRTVLIKDETQYDRFDQAFAVFFDGVDKIPEEWLTKSIPDDWLKKQFERLKEQGKLDEMEKTGDLQKLLETFRERLNEQHKRHQGGNKWVGTGGTSPFGGHGENPEGIRLVDEGENRRAVKVWAQRQYKDLSETQQLNNRNMQMALSRLRLISRKGQAEELDLSKTIEKTAENAGLLDIQMQASARNNIKVLVFFDIGGSMDPFIRQSETLFSALRSQVKHLKYFYFHNFFYESVWEKSERRHTERVSLYDILHTYGPDYKVIVVGDASMAPYEIQSVGGSVEHWNDEPGHIWWQRLYQHFDRVVWLNPEQEKYWSYTTTIEWIKKLVEDKMFPLTVEGIEQASRALTK
ncbi:MAG: hypothetical protein SVC26_00540 [Pseudomonadota bacterium]|nr:hypothetical protein [Pseudomonadota bacterium]